PTRLRGVVRTRRPPLRVSSDGGGGGRTPARRTRAGDPDQRHAVPGRAARRGPRHAARARHAARRARRPVHRRGRPSRLLRRRKALLGGALRRAARRRPRSQLLLHGFDHGPARPRARWRAARRESGSPATPRGGTARLAGRRSAARGRRGDAGGRVRRGGGMGRDGGRRRGAPTSTLVKPILLLATGAAAGVVLWRVLMLDP